jgi:hypothetical protein
MTHDLALAPSNGRRPWRGALALAVLGACLAGAAGAAAPEPAPAPPPALTATATARLLAGVEPGDADPAAARIAASDAWRQHSRAARYGDRQLQQRLKAMNDWQAQHLPGGLPGGTLLYPFSGPDFINAYALFPQADRYVFFSLEPVGRIPALEQMDEAQLAALFGDLRGALNDMVALNFFITPNMKDALQTDALQGTVPVLLALLGLLDLHVDAVEDFQPWPPAKAEAPASAVRIVFTNPRSGRQQSLEYLSLDVSDYALRRHPGFLPWLKGIAQPTVLLKSASYLLHGSHFRQLRRVLLEDSAVIVQDDTGVPYKLLQQAGYELSLFGQYEQPVKLFEERYQPDLEDAFAHSGAGEALPFPFGYNWRKEGKSGLILAQRPAPPATGASAPDAKPHP